MTDITFLYYRSCQITLSETHIFFSLAPPSYAESVRGQTRRYDAVYFKRGTPDMPQFNDKVRAKLKDETGYE